MNIVMHGKLKMSGKVIFTNDVGYELKRIKEISKIYSQKYYVYGNDFKDILLFKTELKDFIFLKLKETMNSKNISVFVNNTDKDFFVLKYPRFSDIMDRNIEAYQTVLKGYKLIIENHPFLGHSDVYWCYFLWSFFNKSLLGYPHAYAFRGNIYNPNKYDCAVLASKVASSTETTIDEVFKDIIVERVALDMESFDLYKNLKSNLFETQTSSKKIIKGLKKFVNTRDTRLKKGFNLLNFNRIFYQYYHGERLLMVSNSKVDVYLESKFWEYINNVNIFMKTLCKKC